MEKRAKNVKMATVRSESEQPLDNELQNSTFTAEILQHASETTVERKVEDCVRGSRVQTTTDNDAPSPPANEDSCPHGDTSPPSNKDATESSCNLTAEVGEQRMDVDLLSNGDQAVSTEPGKVTSDYLHKENKEQETSKETAEESSPKDTIEELADVSEQTEPRGESTQGTKGEVKETEDPNSLTKDKSNTEEKAEEDESKSAGTTSAVKRRKSRLECKECGKKFTRRETYNLHRHFHMHQDEEASLACKECGITFQHRSDLIKHRSTHKEDSKPKFVSNVSRSQIFRKRRRPVEKVYKRKPRKYQCEQCGLCFSTTTRLKLHVCEHKVEKPFRCPLCRREFQYRVSINAHMRSHSLDSPYRCLECNKGFQSVETMHIHQRSHAALKPYECPDCNKVFKHRYVMEDHRRCHAEEKPHQCNVCGKNFKYGSLLQQHKYLHSGQKLYHCSHCNKSFAFAQNMRAHCRQHKKISDSATSEANNANHKVSHGRDLGQVGKENTNRDVERQRNCPLCPQMFYKAADLRAHMLIHEVEYERMSNGKKFDKVYACQFCPLKFTTEQSLQSHSQTHMTNILGVNTSHHVNAVRDKKEDDADIESVSGGGLGDQTEKKPFRCRDCGKCFRYRSVLELHMRIHNKGYQCPVCKKSFRFSSYLQQHSIIHTGKKPYKCPECGKDFAFHHNMKTHQRLHLQKPFRCTQCRKGYSDESQLQRHMLSHTGEKPYKCHLCDKSFSLAYLLRDHINTHTGERPHRCQECHKSFPWLSSLLVHQKIHNRKRQGHGHGYPLSLHSQRGRVREFAGSGRRGRPRFDRDSGRSLALRQNTVPGEILSQQSHGFDADRHESIQRRSQHLQTNNQSQPVQLQQKWQLQIPSPEELLHSQKGLLESQSTDVQMQWPGSHLKAASAQPPNHFAEMTANEQDRKAKHPSVWVNTPNSSQQKTTPESPCHVDGPSLLDVKSQSPRSKSHQSSPNQLLSIQDPHQSRWSTLCDSIQTAKPEIFSISAGNDKVNMDIPSIDDVRKEDLQIQKSSGMVKAVEMGQTGGIMQSTGASGLQNTNPWGLKSSFEMPTTASFQEMSGDALETHQNRLIQHLPQQSSQQIQLLQQQLHQPHLQQQTQITPTWVSATPSNQMGPMNMAYTSARFSLGDRPPLWAFQTAPVVTQALLNGPIQQGHIRAPQHVTLIPSQQIPLNQPSSFITPPFPPPTLNLSAPHPMQLPGPLPQGIFFTSQGTINDMPLMPQVGNLPQLAQPTEPHKIGTKMPFSPDHLFQCMICGCSLPGELELQMHYMQHAQRDV